MPMHALYPALLLSLFSLAGKNPTPVPPLAYKKSTPSEVCADEEAIVCNCSITQNGNTYAINSLQGTVSASAFYSYGVPNGSSAGTGLELNDALVLFLYEDINTGIISLFLIADIPNSGDGGSLQFDFNCAPANSFISVQDDGGEFSGTPPLFTGNWSWGSCCTDGGVIENIGCNSGMNLDLLISSGIDSIVWLTGDIANPTHILLDLNGDDILINCGGAVCCPLNFDSQITSSAPTCPDTPNGSIEVLPQDGVEPYTFTWSNGVTTPLNDNLLPGDYHLTITDALGCMEVVDVTLFFDPGYPPANPAEISACSDEDEALFDLTSIESIVNVGSSFNVLWFENMDLTGAINNPSAYVSGSAIIYAVVDNNSCLSPPVPVTLNLIASPVATPTAVNVCEDSNGEATFVLTDLEGIITGGGGGTVYWYEDSGLNNEINDPEEFHSESTTVYAVWEIQPCLSAPVEVVLTVDLKPEGESTDIHVCGDENNEAIFDLTTVETFVSSGNGTITWYNEIELFDEITTPSNVQTATTTVYAVIFDGFCDSDPIPVDLVVETTPIGNQIIISVCANNAGEGLFDLPASDPQVSGGLGGVDWYYDILLSDPILNPSSFLTESTVVYAVIDNGTCISDAIPIPLLALESPVANPASLETCADSTGQGTFNLTQIDTTVSGGTGNVLWFENAIGDIPILTPTAYVSAGTTVYAQVSNSICLSNIVAVDLIIINAVSATPASMSACDLGSGNGLFNLNTIANSVSSGTGVVSWYFDSMALMLIPNPDLLMSGADTVYARVTAGTCVSEIVPIDLNVLQTPLANDTALVLCGDANGQFTLDLTSLNASISNNVGSVNWFGDVTLINPIANPNIFPTGDTLVFAAVTNGGCTSPVAEVSIAVTPQISANTLSLEFCKPPGDTLLIDLTQYNMQIGGTNQVNWFTDAGGINIISNPSMYAAVTITTLYTNSTDGLCFSPFVPINLTILDDPTANAFTINRCGDTNGEVLIDLTTVEQFISDNTGIVTWYLDDQLMNLLPLPGSFLSGDSVIYATVSNGFCVSFPVPVTVEIVDSLTANPTPIEVCIIDAVTATIDLTDSDFDISGGNGIVSWFTDTGGTIPVANPSAYTTSGGTVYAMVEADGCLSNLVDIPITVESVSTPIPNCIFTSIDSVAMDWSDVTSDYELNYTINGISVGSTIATSSNQFNLGGLGQGDTVVLTITAVFNSICTNPLTNTITCITDVCPAQSVNFAGLQAVYCKDEDYVVLNANPSGGQFTGTGISNDTLYPNQVAGNSTDIFYTWQNNTTGCSYDTSLTISFVDPPPLPFVACASTLNSVTFSWADPQTDFVYTYSINNGPVQGPVTTTNTSFIVNGLNDGEEVHFDYWTVGQPPCRNSDTISMSCFAELCPTANVSIIDPGPFCSDIDPFQLNYTINGNPGTPVATWSGLGIVDSSGIFDPSVSVLLDNDVFLFIEDNGCNYSDSLHLINQLTPEASFILDGTPCLDSVIQLTFTGHTFVGTAAWHWDFDGATATPINIPPTDYQLKWDSPGNYEISLWIERLGCVSNLFTADLEMDAPLSDLEINCVEEDYFALEVSWEPVVGATEYLVATSLGNGHLSGTNFRITNLPDNTPVQILVTAIGPSVCGPKFDTIECRTLDYIPVSFFIPDIFSPNHDGIHDIFFVQSNLIVTNIKALHIFDRWGNMVFENVDFLSNDEKEGWDGTYNGQEMNPGVYVYLVEFETTYGDVVRETGDLTLMR